MTDPFNKVREEDKPAACFPMLTNEGNTIGHEMEEKARKLIEAGAIL